MKTWQAGMRLEALDRKTPSLICVATVGMQMSCVELITCQCLFYVLRTTCVLDLGLISRTTQQQKLWLSVSSENRNYKWLSVLFYDVMLC